MKGYIYKLTVDGCKWVYVGETLDPKRRLCQHRIGWEKTATSKLLLAYGRPEMTILEEVEGSDRRSLKELMRRRETYWMRQHRGTLVGSLHYYHEVKGIQIPEAMLRVPGQDAL